MYNTWKQNKTKYQEKGWASVLSHLCRLIDKSVLAESLWASWVGWLCTSPPFFRDVYVQIRRQESLTWWAGHFAKAPQGILCYTSTLSPRLLCGGTGETRGLHSPCARLGTSLGLVVSWWLWDRGPENCELVEGGRLVHMAYLEPTFQGQKGKCHPQTAPWGCWLGEASASHRELTRHLG